MSLIGALLLTVIFFIGLLTEGKMFLFGLLVISMPVFSAVVLGFVVRIKVERDEGREMRQWAKRNAHKYRYYKRNKNPTGIFK